MHSQYLTIMGESQTPSRKKFLLWTAIVLASGTVLKFLNGKKKQESNTVKMLSQDGKVVEIDKDLLLTSRKKVTNEELQNWIKK
jgi:hypothetical protein